MKKFWILITLCFCVVSRFATAANIVVAYPEVKEPYKAVFELIVQGIQENASETVTPLEFKQGIGSESILSELLKLNADAAIMLGGYGFKYAHDIVKHMPVMVGGYPIKPNGFGGVSMTNDPEIVFAELDRLAPHIQRVYMVYSQSTEWIIPRTQAAANKHGVELVATRADDIKAAMTYYDRLFKRIDPKKDSIWLTLDTVTANDQVVLPYLLEASWMRKFVLFSSKPTHAKRGALFSLFPDNYQLGKRLISMAENTLNNNLIYKVEPMDKFQVAVNLRAAAHLGVQYDESIKQDMHIIVPR
ncbi:ABC transporter substrate binding protein [Catenovulum agarivorans]|uniref:ABC transporter substrate binding protein n=1 Tax=Catenovulum agarivorans TaxID=1172192 RepID=UPI0012FC24ED|nr:ABC transporter substrate binding protein [Catenovulum agarivorans]